MTSRPYTDADLRAEAARQHAGLLEDDDHTRVVGPDMRLGEKRKGGQLVLVVRALAPGEDPVFGRGVAA